MVIFTNFKQKFSLKNPDNISPQDEEKKINLINFMLEVDLGANIIVGGMLIFLIVLVIAWKFNLINYFYKGDKETVVATNTVQFTPKVAASSTLVSGLYIDQQVVSIDKAFDNKPTNKIKLTVTGQLKKEVFGFLPYWAIDKLDQINTTLLTSVSYFGLTVGGDGNLVVSGSDGGLDEAWKDLNDKRMEDFLKKLQRNRVKVLVTLKMFDNDGIQKLVTSPDATDNFVNTALYTISSKNLDGINLDFEYQGPPSQDVIDGYSLLVSKLNKEMKRQDPNSILTVSTYVSAASTTTLDDVAILANNSDSLVIMGYDFTTPASANAGAVAPMDGDGFSLSAALNSYLDKVDSKKLILAVPYYGYDWPVSNLSENASVVGDQSNVNVYTYADIVDLTKGKNIQWDDNSLTPWFSYVDPKTRQPHVVQFENTRSLGIKYDYINQKDLKGVGIWALGFDGTNTELTQLLADKFANQ